MRLAAIHGTAMSGNTYTAKISWTADGDFASGRYQRAHTWQFDGGATIRAAASPHNVPLPYTDPTAIDPDEALVAAASSCHMLWFLHMAKDAGYVVTRYEDAAEGTVGETPEGRTGFTRITLKPDIGFAGIGPDTPQLRELHRQAHARCFVANSLRCDVVIA